MTNEILNRILALLEAMLSIHNLIDLEIAKVDSCWLYNREDQLNMAIMALGEAAKSVMSDKEVEENKKSCFACKHMWAEGGCDLDEPCWHGAKWEAKP